MAELRTIRRLGSGASAEAITAGRDRIVLPHVLRQVVFTTQAQLRDTLGNSPEPENTP